MRTSPFCKPLAGEIEILLHKQVLRCFVPTENSGYNQMNIYSKDL